MTTQQQKNSKTIKQIFKHKIHQIYTNLFHFVAMYVINKSKNDTQNNDTIQTIKNEVINIHETVMVS